MIIVQVKTIHITAKNWNKWLISFSLSFNFLFFKLSSAPSVISFFTILNNYEVIMSFTVVVVTLGPLRESLMSRRNTERFWVNLEEEKSGRQNWFHGKKSNTLLLTCLYFWSINYVPRHPLDFWTRLPYYIALQQIGIE